VNENTLRRIAIVLAALTVLATAAVARAAEDKPAPTLQEDRFFNEVGFITGFGYSKIREGDYLPVPLMVHMGMDLNRWFPSLKDHRGVLTVFIEPQFNLAFGTDFDIEAGVGIGLKYRYSLNDVTSIYGLASVGSSRYHRNTKDQADGFVFADTVGVGIALAVMPGACLDLGVRLRHLSNADLKEPNFGIDTIIGTVGFTISR